MPQSLTKLCGGKPAPQILRLLTAPEAVETKSVTYRYFVELASIESYIDGEGFDVPVAYRTIDVVVLEPSREAIALLIASCDWLKGYQMVSHWTPELEDAPF
ncbi:MAG: hypothetical protein ACRC06_14955 [Waterburya sp.]